MNRRLIGLGTGGVLWLSLLGGCAAEQQDPQCVVARAVSDGSTGSFATTYELKPGQAASACSKLTAEAVGMQKYFNQDPNGLDSVGVRTGTLTNPVNAKLDAAAPNQPNSVGDLTTKAPGPDHFCEVPSLSTTRLVGRYLLKDKSLGAPFDVTYAWSSLRIYNTPDVPGTQFIADLRYTINGCTAEFTARGIWPVVSCATSGKPDETKCLPYADPPTRLRGSGINPSFPVKCDPDALICVLTGDVPSVP